MVPSAPANFTAAEFDRISVQVQLFIDSDNGEAWVNHRVNINFLCRGIRNRWRCIGREVTFPVGVTEVCEGR
jgi:hypothetical protein